MFVEISIGTNTTLFFPYPIAAYASTSIYYNMGLFIVKLFYSLTSAIRMLCFWSKIDFLVHWYVHMCSSLLVTCCGMPWESINWIQVTCKDVKERVLGQRKLTNTFEIRVGMWHGCHYFIVTFIILAGCGLDSRRQLLPPQMEFCWLWYGSLLMWTSLMMLLSCSTQKIRYKPDKYLTGHI